jgi:ABC-2 type transport system permease protein
MLSYIRYELRSRRGSIIGWGSGAGLFVLLYSLMYPAMPAEMLETDWANIEAMQAFGQMEMGTFEAYFASVTLNFVPLIVAIFAVVNGTGTLAGEEENGTLELMVTLPLQRWEIVVSKALAMAASAFLILCIVSVGGVLAAIGVNSQMESHTPPLGMIVPILNVWPLTLALMMISLFLGALLPQRRFAAGAGALVVLVSFLGNNLLPMIESMDPVTALLPHRYYEHSPTTFAEGIHVGNALVLITAALVFVLLAVVSFSQRNLTTGLWLWQRGKIA